MAKRKRTKGQNHLQSMTQEIKDRATRTPLSTGGELLVLTAFPLKIHH
jgi:hypothetical protein